MISRPQLLAEIVNLRARLAHANSSLRSRPWDQLNHEVQDRFLSTARLSFEAWIAQRSEKANA